MAWDADSLWAKARLFIDRAFEQQDDDGRFGLWAAFSLELLTRASLASVHPVLLAEPDPEHVNVLHAIGRVPNRNAKSIAAVKALRISKRLFEGISEADLIQGTALINKRNEELHTGAAAFDEYPSHQWLVGFHRLCATLCKAQNRSLEEFYGKEEAVKAEEMLQSATDETRSKVQQRIAAHRKVFDDKNPEERAAAASQAEKSARELEWRGHHIRHCPACKSRASMSAEPYGKEMVSLSEDEVTIRQPMMARELKCLACGLHLRDVGELDAARLGGRYISVTHSTPAEHFGLLRHEDALDYVIQREGEYQDE